MRLSRRLIRLMGTRLSALFPALFVGVYAARWHFSCGILVQVESLGSIVLTLGYPLVSSSSIDMQHAQENGVLDEQQVVS